MAYLKMIFQTSLSVGYVSIPYRGYVPAVNLPGGVGFQGGSLPRGPPPRWIDAPSTSRLEGVWRVRMLRTA